MHKFFIYHTFIIYSHFLIKEHGFFMESGAHDGEDLSNTLFFERFRQWTGLLIEPQPQFYKKLKMKNRKSYTLNACICANQDWPSTVCS